MDGEKHLVGLGDLDSPGEWEEVTVPRHDVDLPGVVSVNVVEDVGAAALAGRGSIDGGGAGREGGEEG